MHEQIALLDEAPNTDVGLLSLASYASATHPAYEAFETRPSYETAIALSHAIVNAAFDAASSDTRVLISCSWGKDSSAVVGIITEVLLARRSSGLVNPAILLMVADTGSEFIDMANRVVTENASLEKWAAREGFALKTQVVSPAPKNTLLSELIGSGRTLPSYQQSNRATINSWCVSRLKIGPMQRALELAKADGAKLIHFLGVRMEESERRNASITRYSLGMPFGLTRVSDGKGDSNGELDPNRIGCQPIVHWTHEILTQYLRRSMPAWDPFSFESLKVIYRKGAAPEDINGAGECRIAFTRDGGVSNVCSDLGGARFGCLNCVMSANRSLANYAKNDASYRWVKAVHGFIRNGMKQHKTRMDDSAAHGFTIETLFPKNQTFEWRYKLAMFVYRSQIESGHIQLTAQMETAINHWWERSGIHTVTMDDARADAVAWKATGKLRMSWKADSFNYEGLSISLSEGIPAGIYAAYRHPDMADLSLANLMSFVGRGNAFFPQLKAYVFRDTGSRGGLLTYLTDCPSDMGRTLNTDSLSGYEGFALDLIGVRDVTPWEKRLMRGRAVFYRHTPEGLQSRISEWLGRPWVPGLGAAGLIPAFRLTSEAKSLSKSARRTAERFSPATCAQELHEVILANMEFAGPCGEKALIDYLDESHFIAQLRGSVTRESIKALFDLVTAAVDLSDALTVHHERSASAIRKVLGTRMSEIGASSKERGTAETREILRSLLREGWDIGQSADTFDAYISIIRDLRKLVVSGSANTEIINRIAYISRTAIYDEVYAAELTNALTQLLGISSPAGQVQQAA